MNNQIRKDKIEYLNDISRLNNKPLKGAELLLAYEGFNKNLSIKECIKYINDNKELKEKELEEENKKLKDSLMRTLAELENTRRIAGEEREKTAKFAISKFAEDLIPVMEDFYLAFKNSENKDNANEIFFDGVKLTHNELKKVFD